MLKSQKMAVRGRTKESQGSKSTFKLRQLHGSLQRLATDQQRKQKYLEEMVCISYHYIYHHLFLV